MALEVQAGDSIVVFGAGAVGLAAVMAAVVAGSSPIIAVDLHEHRLDLARELGATHVLDGASDGLVEQIQAITAGGADFSFDTAGKPAVIYTALGALRLGGHCGLVGIQMEPLTLDPTALLGKRVSNILEGSADPHQLVAATHRALRAGRFPFDRLIETFPMERINEAESRLARRGGEAGAPAACRRPTGPVIATGESAVAPTGTVQCRRPGRVTRD